MSTTQLRNIGPKSAAWLRQVGLRTEEDLRSAGAVDAFMKVKRAGFRPSLNLLYALEGALRGCHWQEVPEARRQEMVQEVEVASAALPPPRGRPAAAPVTTTNHGSDEGGSAPSFDFLDSPGRDDD
ncbi:TfoX C-terminal domain-containing protein [Pseudoxanthomonas sp. GM95]|uniref:TfoX/Sxy family protein n=1 Tax=Pseudoxanthomonas sp. GM95 TaxID=1881043 RepID=UPI0008C18E81|nr:TfoX/Sxy family protein [Pseudoxanthomonas sp. GM95]SEL47628.1 TfoX C-terminal domain-containing protein [Pseudoxanthomonas sp. GM95]